MQRRYRRTNHNGGAATAGGVRFRDVAAAAPHGGGSVPGSAGRTGRAEHPGDQRPRTWCQEASPPRHHATPRGCPGAGTGGARDTGSRFPASRHDLDSSSGAEWPPLARVTHRRSRQRAGQRDRDDPLRRNPAADPDRTGRCRQDTALARNRPQCRLRFRSGRRVRRTRADRRSRAGRPDSCGGAQSVRGEQVVPLAPMALANPDRVEHVADLAGVPAIDLFVQRATSVRPDFALTDANARDVAAICARLDGLPLAIELAAIRIRTLSPATLVGLLSERLRLLTSGPRDAPARQQTLRAAIEWSHNLLDAKQQQCFRRLAVFAGGCTLESVTAITDDDDPFAALDALEALVDQGLALRSNDTDSDPRFRMLETVREYALERLHASGDADSIRAAQAHYLVALAERAGPQLHGPAPGRWLDLLDTEQDNFRAALAWSLGDTGDTGNASMALSLTAALWPFWHMRGHLQEGHSWLERAVAGGDQVDPAIRAGAFLDLANVANNLEDHSRARDLYEEMSLIHISEPTRP